MDRGLAKVANVPVPDNRPGFGTIGGPPILERLERYLGELRRQVGHLVAQERSLEDILSEVRIQPEWLVWMPYDQPQRPDIEHVYRELTVTPIRRSAAAQPPRPLRGRRHWYLLAIGPMSRDISKVGLRPALEQAGVSPFFAVDTRALTAANLEAVRLLVILRDGAAGPAGRPSSKSG